ncbi:MULTISPECIES: carbohydrate ABC transporter permease [Carnobacterium]|nr:MULTISPECIES: carbohydrate ABC transporter permease [Carnobacterium]ANZ98723.1 ABC transporter permease [Carnobacterium divergens]MCO6019116.1 carbohydrate ABC transporter permease [Carnobacterium divergens]MDO0875467.1 carbohydrate ABC transporter permease [Carnobacterium divergens]MDT1940103.1 carbohydrate ABC transporter permease [Carnobacterium divergens]MDT1942541.1 carbohydrate ABC transporter permease [Carnobacterium divergens]
MALIKKKSQMKESRSFYLINTILLVLFTLIIIIPIWNVIVSSVSSGKALADGGLMLWPKELTFDNYKRVLSDGSILNAFFISVSKTVLGALTHVLFCSIMAYALSKKRLVGRGFYTTFGVITLYFGGGMIPYYLLIRSLGLLNSFWVYIIPSLLSYYDVIILMNFFREVPVSLEESARIDGANDWTVFFRIFLPLSKPALATITLFSGVAQWNDFMTTKMFITDKALYPLQMKIYEIIVQSQMQGMDNMGASAIVETTTRGVQLATIVITTIPILIIYPLLQKYFISGMMVGAVKE